MKPIRAAVLAAMLLIPVLANAMVDANTASEVELESISGIGPATSERIVNERRRGPFRDPPDFMRRIKGVGEAKMRKMMAAGLRIGAAGTMILTGGGEQVRAPSSVQVIAGQACSWPKAARPRRVGRNMGH